MDAADDLLARVWRTTLFCGDAPANVMLTVDDERRATVDTHVAHGVRQLPDVDAGPFDDVLAALDAHAPSPAGPAGHAVVDEVVDRLPLIDWMAAAGRPDGDPAARAIADGDRQVPCPRCDHTGHLRWLACDSCGGAGCHTCGEAGTVACDRCAGSGTLRLDPHVTFAGPEGVAVTAPVSPDLLDVQVVERRPANPERLPEVLRRTTRLVRLDVGRLARQLHDGGLDVDATWVRCGPRGTSERPRPGVPAPRTGRPYPAVVAGRLARHVCGLLSAGADTARPDVPTFTRPSWVAAGRAALVSHGDDGQPDRVTIHVRPPRPATVTFDELTGRLPGLSDALPSGWRARLSLATGFIATGEHGPHVTVWAAPDDHRRAPVVLADRTDHGLRRVLETVDDDLALLGDPVGWVAATVG